MLLADQLNIKRETVRSIVRIWMIEGRVNRLQRGGARNVKMTEEMQLVMLDIISERPFSTLADINREMRNRLPLAPRVTDTTIARHLEGKLITVKIAGKDSDVPAVVRMGPPSLLLPADRNKPANIEKRQQYAMFLTNLSVNDHLIYID